jgi:hypothetical protein
MNFAPSQNPSRRKYGASPGVWEANRIAWPINFAVSRVDQVVSLGLQDATVCKRMNDAGFNPDHIGQVALVERIRLARPLRSGHPADRHPARTVTARRFPRRAVMLSERLDPFDHTRSAEEIAMTLQCLDKTRRRTKLPTDSRKEGVAICS